ncbi:hypothetical protein DBZ36_11110 [Alginatibacterium sediminis]|uniref:Glycosyltransferase n=1 Tax=Alginatibacterium sediminis TaxID=2164068 RepID=A0A420EAY1_9ALTE|nr:hypothetical protein [Alginatibacterium sediminis]RKF17802.1 hypothetical protein DBZ36_11110 [Alginatibacterium sediminis]
MSCLKKISFVSVVIVEKDIENGQLESCIESTSVYLSSRYSDYEILIIQEGSSNSHRVIWKNLLLNLPSIRVIQVSNQLDRELAFSVGLENAIGDHVVLINPSVDPLELIEQGVERNEEGYDVVTGVNSTPNSSIFYKIVRPLINKILVLIGSHHEKNSTDFYCLSRNAANTITLASSKKYNLRVKIGQCFFEMTSIVYSQGQQCNYTRKTVLNAVPLAFNMLIFNSVKPLKYMAALGATASAFSLLFASYSFLMKFFDSETVEGWTSTIMLISLLFTILFIILSFMAEYMSRMLDETNKGRPYWIVNELHSKVMVDEDRYNVMERSQ